jgi:hypothetical protein
VDFAESDYIRSRVVSKVNDNADILNFDVDISFDTRSYALVLGYLGDRDRYQKRWVPRLLSCGELSDPQNLQSHPVPLC